MTETAWEQHLAALKREAALESKLAKVTAQRDELLSAASKAHEWLLRQSFHNDPFDSVNPILAALAAATDPSEPEGKEQV